MAVVQGFQPHVTRRGLTRPAELAVAILLVFERDVVFDHRKGRIVPVIIRNRDFDRTGHPDVGIETLHETGRDTFHRLAFPEVDDHPPHSPSVSEASPAAGYFGL